MLLLSNSTDPHVPPVEAELDQMGIHHVRLDTDLAWPHTAVETVVDADGHRCRLHTGGNTVDLGEVTAIGTAGQPLQPCPAGSPVTAVSSRSRRLRSPCTARSRSLRCAWPNHPDTVRVVSIQAGAAPHSSGVRISSTEDLHLLLKTLKRSALLPTSAVRAIAKLVSPGRRGSPATTPTTSSPSW